MFDKPRRQHPVAAITSVLRALRELLLPLVIVFLFGRRGDPEETAFWLRMLPVLGIIIFAFTAGVLQWVFFRYWLAEDELRVTRGLFVRKRIFIPRHRIQVIDITSGIIQRSFGLVSLNVQTAGGDTPGVIINALRLEEALEIRKLLRRSERHAEAVARSTNDSVFADGDSGEKTASETINSIDLNHGNTRVVTPDSRSNESDPYADSGRSEIEYKYPENCDQSWRLPADHLLIGAATSGGFGVFLSLLATLYTQVSYMIDEEEMIDWFSRLAIPEGSTIVVIGIVVIVLAWIMSFSSYVLGFANFRIRKINDEMVITKGLIERKQITIPFRRIQCVRIVEGLMRQPFGFVTIRVDSAGFGEKSGQTTELMPLLPIGKVPEFLEVMLPEYQQDIPLNHAPRRAMIRFMIQASIPVLLLSSILTWALPMGYLAWVAFPLATFLGYRRYRDAGAGWNGRMYRLSYRKLARTTCLIPGFRVQASQTSADPLQRLRDLKDLSVDVASSNTGAQFTVPNLDQIQADNLSNKLEWDLNRHHS
jgi:putative membrane protein